MSLRLKRTERRVIEMFLNGLFLCFCLVRNVFGGKTAAEFANSHSIVFFCVFAVVRKKVDQRGRNRQNVLCLNCFRTAKNTDQQNIGAGAAVLPLRHYLESNNYFVRARIKTHQLFVLFVRFYWRCRFYRNAGWISIASIIAKKPPKFVLTTVHCPQMDFLANRCLRCCQHFTSECYRP